jgi:drug/metabolite transporter (DMT)-like permease
MMLAGTALLSLYAAPALMATDWTALPGIVWITLVYVAVAASAMTFVLLQYATLRLPSAKVMAYTYLVPSWVILWEIALHGAVPPGLVLAGVGLTGLALWLLLKEEQ